MQNQTTVEPAPAPPVAPPPPIIVRPGELIGRPLTRQEIASIRARRSELSDQLQSAAARRGRLANQLREADPAARAGLEQRIAVLDGRIVQLEEDIATTGRQLTEAGALQGSATMPAPQFGGFTSGQATAISIVFLVVVLFPIAIALARLMWKRATAPVRAVSNPEDSKRLERLEQAVDTVAIEMERVSEGQRFLTKLLMEPNAIAALEAGQAVPDAMLRKREPVPTRDER